jgi:hypothetical protein
MPVGLPSLELSMVQSTLASILRSINASMESMDSDKRLMQAEVRIVFMELDSNDIGKSFVGPHFKTIYGGSGG